MNLKGFINEKTMIIGYDAKRIVCNKSGLGSYARTLINDISRIAGPDIRLNLYAPTPGNGELRRQIRESAEVRFVYPNFCGNCIMRAWWRMHGMVKALLRDGVDLYHGLSGELPIGIKEAGINTVVTIHDLIFMRHPEWYGPIDTRIYSWKFRRTCQEADRIIAISECTKRDIMLFGDIPPEKIDVIYQSCGMRYKMRESEKRLQEVHTAYMLPQRYIVSVGTIEERKNILLAVKAMRLLPEDISLVVVGKPTPYLRKVSRFIASAEMESRVKFLHNVPDEDLPAIYQMAEASVYPSRYEGFGVPVIEAIQSGLPVVACTGSCLEEAGGNGALYVDPDDVYGMAEAMKKILKGSPEREQRIAESQRYVSRFENADVAQQVMDVYYKTMKG